MGSRRDAFRRSLLEAVIVLYLVLLILDGWPKVLLPAAFEPLHALSGRILGVIGVEAGQAVFADVDSAEFKPRAYCVLIVGHTGDDRVRVVHRELDDCLAPKPRLLTDYIKLSHQLIVMRGSNGLARSDEAEAMRQGHQYLRTLGDYYCHSRLVENEDLTKVSIIHFITTMSDVTGETRTEFRMSYHWSCTENQLVSEPWPDERALVAALAEA